MNQLSLNLTSVPELNGLSPLEQQLFSLRLQYSLEESFSGKMAIWEHVVNTEIQLTEQQVKNVVALVVNVLQKS